MEDKKSYYAIIPANIRYDNNISANAKLLYGEITALCNECGYCWANNKYFADLYNVSKKTVSLWIKQLVDAGYILSQITYDSTTKEILERTLSLPQTYLQKCNGGMERNVNTPTHKNVMDNNTSMNITLKENKKESPLDGFDFTEKVKSMVYTWLGYKKEKGQTYKPTGLNTLLKKVEKWQKEFGEDYVVNAIDSSITNNYAGLFPAKQQYTNTTTQNYATHNYTKEQMNQFDDIDDLVI